MIWLWLYLASCVVAYPFGVKWLINDWAREGYSASLGYEAIVGLEPLPTERGTACNFEEMFAK